MGNIDYSKPLLPPRHCHDGGVVTYGYWCKKCRKKRKEAANADDHPDDYYRILI